MPKRGSQSLEISVEAQRRRQIIEAVMACISDEGVEKTTMRNVAQRAGVSTGTLAYYFKSKKDLVDAALLDATERYMERFNRERRPPSPAALDQLIERFLSLDNANAAFALQMIEVGLHNSELRGAHLEMVEAGRRMILDCIRFGMESGEYRNDIDPELAAALLHGVLIWWGSELVWNATSRDLAVNVSRLLLRLLSTQPDNARSNLDGASRRDEFHVVEHVRSVLMADPHLPREKARALAGAFAQMYAVASPETTVKGA
ncbi:MAG TPA: TetR/AcrR family transcriptional regulator [Dehalococcoidia bacterium]|nr:TetR/AcrR family transcriptional regulator [Dehalococcoidia bacterium]